MDALRKYARVIGVVVATFGAVGVLTNVQDIERCVRNSMM